MPFSYFTYYSAILYSSYNCHIVSTHSENNLLLSIIYRCIKATQSNDVFMLFFRNTVCIFYHFRMGTDHSDILSSLHIKDICKEIVKLYLHRSCKKIQNKNNHNRKRGTTAGLCIHRIFHRFFYLLLLSAATAGGHHIS